MNSKYFNRLWLIVPIIIAIIILLILPKFKKPPQQHEPVEKAFPVKVIKAVRLPFMPQVSGYGTTQASQSWQAIAEISGAVSWMSEKLKAGNIIDAGSHILTLDDQSYQLTLKQKISQIELLKVKVNSTNKLLGIEQKRYQSLQSEVKRKQKLLKRGSLSASDFDELQRNLLNIELAIQNHKNNLMMYQSEIELLNVQKEQTELEITKAKIMAPMDIRVTEVNANLNQYINKGQTLLSADGIEQVEVEARIPIGKLRPLLASKKEADTDIVHKTPGAKRLKAKVILKTATHRIEWPARVERVSGVIDQQTQTLGIVVVVDKPYQQAQPGKRPPLIRNTLVEVQLTKQGQGEPIVIPQSALRQGKVYLLDSENRLKIIKVKASFKRGNLVAIAKGLEQDEMIVISKLTPAIEGMLLDPVKDKKAIKRLKMEASGQQMKKGQSL